MISPLRRLPKRIAYAGLAIALAVSGLVPGILMGHAGAFPTGAQLQSRSVQISNSTVDASGVTYAVGFKPQSNYTIKGIIVDFCSDTPIIGDTNCITTSPSNLTNFSVGTPTVNFTPSATSVGITGATDLGGTWTSTAQNSGRTLRIVDATGVAVTSGVTYDFVFTGVHNPNFNGTFYARIITYTSNTGDVLSYAPGTEGSTAAKDYGGVAISTANNISITAKVQETLTFCVSGTDLSPASICSAATTPTLTLGHGTTTKVLDQTAVDTASAYTQLSTNANGGVAVRMKSSNSCTNGGLSSSGGAVCNIPGNGSTAAAIAAGTAAFGLFVADSTANTTGGSGTSTPATTYHNASHVTIASDLWYGMNGTNVTSTYGDTIFSTSGPVSLVNNQLVFGATAALTTQAGIYTATEILNATGTF